MDATRFRLKLDRNKKTRIIATALHSSRSLPSTSGKIEPIFFSRVNQIDLGNVKRAIPVYLRVRNESSSGRHSGHAAARNLDKRRRLFVFPRLPSRSRLRARILRSRLSPCCCLPPAARQSRPVPLMEFLAQ